MKMYIVLSMQFSCKLSFRHVRWAWWAPYLIFFPQSIFVFLVIYFSLFLGISAGSYRRCSISIKSFLICFYHLFKHPRLKKKIFLSSIYHHNNFKPVSSTGQPETAVPWKFPHVRSKQMNVEQLNIVFGFRYFFKVLFQILLGFGTFFFFGLMVLS